MKTLFSKNIEFNGLKYRIAKLLFIENTQKKDIIMFCEWSVIVFDAQGKLMCERKDYKSFKKMAERLPYIGRDTSEKDFILKETDY